MDFNSLVDQIVAKVSEKMAEEKTAEVTTNVVEECCDNKPGILILANEHGNICTTLAENKELLSHYRIDCALDKEYNVDIEKYDNVVIFNVTNNILTKMAGGISDTKFTDLIAKAILMGKNVFIPKEEVELYSYKETAPAVFYNMLNDKLTFLRQCGVAIENKEKLIEILLKCNSDVKHVETEQIFAGTNVPAVEYKEVPQPKVENDKVYELCKKVITEGDVRKALSSGYKVIQIQEKALISDLAKETAKISNISFVRGTCL